MVNIARFDVFAMTILGKITNKKALTIYTILGAGILLSLILASPVAYTWAQYQLHGAGNNSIYSNTQMQYMKMFGYIDNDKEMVQSMVQKVLSPALGRPAEIGRAHV